MSELQKTILELLAGLGGESSNLVELYIWLNSPLFWGMQFIMSVLGLAFAVSIGARGIAKTMSWYDKQGDKEQSP